MGRHLDTVPPDPRDGAGGMHVDYAARGALAEIAELEAVLARLRVRGDRLATLNLWCLEELLRRRQADLAGRRRG